MNELLISFEEALAIVPNLAENVKRDDFDKYLLSVMRVRFRELIGADKYTDLITNPNTAENIDFFKGTPPSYFGCREWIIYNVMIDYAQSTNLRQTRVGLVVKRSDHSDAAQSNEIKNYIDYLSQLAGAYENAIKLQLQNSCKNANSTGVLPRTQFMAITKGISNFPKNGY